MPRGPVDRYRSKYGSATNSPNTRWYGSQTSSVPRTELYPMHACRCPPVGSVVVRVNGSPRSIRATVVSHVTVNSRGTYPFCSAHCRSLWAGVPS